MANVKRIACLANSRKLSGRCVAGREVTPNGGGNWVRPISVRPAEEVSKYERQYEDGSDPRVLDIIDVPLLSPKPNPYQPENWLLDPDRYWERVGRLSWDDLSSYTEEPSTLWENGLSTNSGSNDQVLPSNATGLSHSLYFLYIRDIWLRVFAPGAAFNRPKRRVQALFRHQGVSYAIWVTDPVCEDKYLAGTNGDYQIGECYVTVSLGEPYEGYCYKFVAAIITPQIAQA